MYLKTNLKLRLDHIFANSAKGIVAYGIMPSALVFLGVLKIEKLQLPGAYGWLEIASLIFIVSIPFCILCYILGRRLERYYLFKDYLWARSFIVTFEILIGVTAVGLASGFLTGNLIITNKLTTWISPLLHSLIGGIATLSLSSTLFATLLTENTNLPGLPSKEYADLLAEIKFLIASLQEGKSALVWKKKPLLDKTKTVYVQEILIKLKAKFDILQKLIEDNRISGDFFITVDKDIENILKALGEIENGAGWEKYFSDTNDFKRDSNEMLIMVSVSRFLNARWSKR
ncbi:MAG: hypothetical protein IH589_01650 [Anaerolineales bacterium]|nr:hypothetical protein [Anaerolineales bacterium]